MSPFTHKETSALSLLALKRSGRHCICVTCIIVRVTIQIESKDVKFFLVFISDLCRMPCLSVG